MCRRIVKTQKDLKALHKMPSVYYNGNTTQYCIQMKMYHHPAQIYGFRLYGMVKCRRNAEINHLHNLVDDNDN